ncbi:hypothetical protein M2323_001247 [Rhodoblastus acidophilus]|uniref:hypothetical protein n=1 Tax=Rhodoblastus acidophilus TaxID=1074 RepID=UPI0022259E9F|nr:hypothetical protein [Rhodoblastus acidophilus]MCW2283339.1 hypothetical protein [Rhodoblastus acidophilus]MCW2332337.1 hypothetical protein [Rhodoblastus acidophilus]
MNIRPVDLPAQPADAAVAPQNARLVNYALHGLEKCWLPEQERWSHIYHLDGRAAPNESLPRSDVFYTLNVLLGLSRVAAPPDGLDVNRIFARNASELTRLPVRKYAFGMALWAGAELGLELPGDCARELRILLSDPNAWRDFHAQDLGMLLTGVAAQVRAGQSAWREFAAPLFRFLQARFLGESGLFCDTPAGLRRRFASFATQVYLSLACYHYGDVMDDPSATTLASQCVEKLMALQGPQGEWPWFYDAVSGRVLDFYEVYSVHQYGMAPALLEWAEREKIPGATAALVKGFEWVFGANQLGRPMLAPGGLTIRSQIRKVEGDAKVLRAARAISNALLGRSGGLIAPEKLGLRLECRSYELGWILWSFGRRVDLPQLTENDAFSL